MKKIIILNLLCGMSMGLEAKGLAALTNKIDAEINGLPYNIGKIQTQQNWNQLKQAGISKGVRALSQLEMFYSSGIVSSQTWELIGFWTWTGRNSFSRPGWQMPWEMNSTPSPSFFPQITSALNNTTANVAWNALQTEGNNISQANWWNCGIHALAGLYSMQADGILPTAIIDDINAWIQSN